MEEFNDNVYVIDLGNVNSAPEIIFALSSILDDEEAKNKRICLKLGNVDLNQAQLLSIKSLINGIDSTLSSIDTKSIDTEKVALSLGIIVSNISAENSSDVAPTMPYKTAEELKEELQSQEQSQNVEENYDIIEDPEENSQVNPESEDQNIEQPSDNVEQTDSEQNQTEQDPIPVDNNTNQDTENNQTPEISSNEEVMDELDVIFGSSPAKTTFMEMEASQPLYEEREEMADIIVPEQEYTKEDIELESFPTKYIKQTIRSGQVINYEGNIVIIGDCHPGCEITAFGDITVWGILSGIAHAGAGGNQKARVRALKMNAIQLRIASCYSRRPDSLNTVYIEKTNSFTPEEARIVNGEIVVFKIND